MQLAKPCALSPTPCHRNRMGIIKKRLACQSINNNYNTFI